MTIGLVLASVVFWGLAYGAIALVFSGARPHDGLEWSVLLGMLLAGFTLSCLASITLGVAYLSHYQSNVEVLSLVRSGAWFGVAWKAHVVGAVLGSNATPKMRTATFYALEVAGLACLYLLHHHQRGG